MIFRLGRFTKKLSYNWVVAVSLALLSSLMFAYVVALGGLYFQHDGYYYLAVADSLLEVGQMLDASTIPPTPVISPQNGIVFVMVLLKAFGITSNIDVLFTIGLINYMCFALFGYLLYLIYKIFGVDRHTSFVFAASVVSSLYYARIYIQSINDPIFITLSTFVVYLILQKKKDYKTFILLGLCALLLAEFRISGVLVFFSATIAYLYLRNIRMAMIFVFLTLITYLVQELVVNYFILNQDGIAAMKQKVFDYYSYKFFIGNIAHTLKVNIPEGLFAFEKIYTDLRINSTFIAFIISGSVIVGFLSFAKKGVVAKDFKYIYLTVYIMAYICFLQLFFVVITRYILVIAPFFAMLLFLMLAKKKRVYLAYGLLFISLSITLLVPPNDLRTKDGVSKALFYTKMNAILKDKEYDSVVSNSRVAYLLLGQPSTWPIDKGRKNILVVGPQAWSMAIIRRLKSVNRNCSQNIQQLESYINYSGSEINSYFIECR